MIEIKGLYNTALCYVDTLADSAAEQIQKMCDSAELTHCRIRIMPDVHAGKGCTVGTTMTVADKVVPGMVGVDIGCGMETVKIAEREIDLDALDALIRAEIPYGTRARQIPHPKSKEVDLFKLRCAPFIHMGRAHKSIGTLGGGNHFIEVDRSESGDLYIVVHSGSRHLGVEVCEHYQEEGYRAICRGIREELDSLGDCDVSMREALWQELQSERSMAYVEGQMLMAYLHDMKIVQQFAALNRRVMVETILSGLGLTAVEQFTTTHNYIDTYYRILRKGSVSAQAGEKLLIPINMRDGALVCVGKGNPEWNFSAPHGAGRLLNRTDAKEKLCMEEYRTQMEGIYTTCVSASTLDESPMAYKSIESILSQIGETVEVLEQIKPIYNFKA